MKARGNWLYNRRTKFSIWTIAISVVLVALLSWIQLHPHWVEAYYSRGFYPRFSFLSIVLFAWLPFSFGDLFYAGTVLLACYFFYSIIRNLWNKKWQSAARYVLHLVALIFSLYVYFYVNWGLNYYRIPLATQLNLDVNGIGKTEYLQTFEKYIATANSLRENLDLYPQDKKGVHKDLEEWVRADTSFSGILSTSQINAKSPLSSKVASYFAVSGYFNPFTQEVQVNQLIPSSSYPFVNVHELAHQMGIGFEDECNFIAFRTLKDHSNDWYRYSAYYEVVKYFLISLAPEKALFEKYKNLLSPKVREDLQNEQEFWRQYAGWINDVFGAFYNQYLKHNNQPEGTDRYSMVTRLVVAWEKQNKKL